MSARTPQCPATPNKEKTMAKYLMLKHYRGHPDYIDFVPMDTSST